MVRRLLPLLLLALGCRAGRGDVSLAVESQVVGLTPPALGREVVPSSPAPAPERIDLPTLWKLALANNPSLREAAADVEATRGRWIQAGLYPNPRVIYNQDTIGSRLSQQGNFTVQVNQEIVTGGKRRLDRAVAERETASSAVGLIGRKFEVLTRIRRAYYDYLALRSLLRLNGETVEVLEKGLEVARQQVEKAKTRPLTDVLRLEALLEEARITQARARDALEGAWRQLAAEVGLPHLPMPADPGRLCADPPNWDDDIVLRRVLSSNAALKQAAVEVERADLAVRRARAAAIPNVTFGAGYDADNTDQTAGLVINVETNVPVWNRNQGAVYEARARLASAHAAVRTTENRLTRETADALARFKAARRQVERLDDEVLPRLQKSLTLLRKAYQAGSAQVAFSDVLLTQQNLNTTRLTLAEARRSLWQAVADLEGLMQLEVGEGWDCPPAHDADDQLPPPRSLRSDITELPPPLPLPPEDGAATRP
jgi:cobalt-zinc-cadmium efflux system outer membrane protein